MFTPLRYDSGKLVRRPVATTQTIVKGDALIWSSGYVAVAASTTEDVYAVAMEDSYSQATGTLILVLPVEGVEFEALCDDVVSIADRGTRCDLGDEDYLNPDATTEMVFLIEEIVGKEEVSKKVIGHFCRFTAT